MIFWAATILLALVASALIAVSLMRGRASAAPPAAYDLEVYRVQLRDVDKDLARGVITEAEGARLRTEVSRRILAADAQLREGGVTGGQPKAGGRVLAGILAIAVTGGAFGFYLWLGAPGYRDMPREARLAASDAARADRLTQEAAVSRFGPPEVTASPPEEFAQLMEQLRATVAKRPDDQRGLALLARNEASLGNTRAAAEAQSRLITVKGDTASAADHAFLADLLITAAGGYVSQEAEGALRTALSLDADQPEARYYLGVYYAQVDRPDAAFRTWDQLLRDSAPDAVWIAPVRAQIEEMAARAGISYTLPPVAGRKGPTAEQIEDAQGMSDEGRQQFITTMVNNLMERLSTEGGPPEDWARLITSLGVLGEDARATAIRDEAREVFKDDPAALRMIAAAAADAGLPE